MRYLNTCATVLLLRANDLRFEATHLAQHERQNTEK
jgi:hypothetical protein